MKKIFIRTFMSKLMTHMDPKSIQRFDEGGFVGENSTLEIRVSRTTLHAKIDAFRHQFNTWYVVTTLDSTTRRRPVYIIQFVQLLLRGAIVNTW